MRILTILLFLIASSIADSLTLRFSCGAPTSEYQAQYISPILKAALNNLGIKMELEYNPSARSLVLSNSGEYDGELHRVDNFHSITSNQYSNLHKLEPKILSIWLSIFTKDSSISIDKWEDLANYDIVYYRGRKNVKTFTEKYVPSHKVFNSTTDQQAVKMLLMDRVQILISESRQTKQILKDEGIKEIFELKKIKETKIHIYLHSKHSSLIPKIEKELKRILKTKINESL